MSDENDIRPIGTVSIGDELYGLSRDELRARIEALKSEIVRTEAALTQKINEMAAADTVFGKKPDA